MRNSRFREPCARERQPERTEKCVMLERLEQKRRGQLIQQLTKSMPRSQKPVAGKECSQQRERDR